jgi:NitT/TauT family transport system permease protein
MVVLLSEVSRSGFEDIFVGAGATFLRVELVLLLAALLTIPFGVFIGLRPRLAAIAQPVAQIAASVPATALFPIVLLGLIRLGGDLGIGSIVLLLLGTQWYLLFNVIAGASAIPTDLSGGLRRVPPQQRRPLAKTVPAGDLPLFDHRLRDRFRRSVECEYRGGVLRFHGRTFSTTGLGAVISRAADRGAVAVLLGAPSRWR